MTFLVAYGSAVCGRASSGLFTGRLAAPDINEFGRTVAVEEEDVDSMDFVVAVEVTDAFDATLDMTGGAIDWVLGPVPRWAMDFDFAGVIDAIEVAGRGGP